ncbi:MAG: polymer-forming cytoskeletal protein [Oscillospiraceae bacterium]|nr:polymer-forming cytoskeletal protein [Oscillospiraceae bacterium]
MFKKTSADEDTMDWATPETLAPAVAAAAAPAASNVYQPAAGCVISAGTVFTGNIEANDNVILEGRMTGDIASTGRVRVIGKLQGNAKAASLILDKGEITGDVETEESLTVEPGSTLTGNVIADTARINGTVQGNLKVTGLLALCSQAVLTGDLVAGSVVMEAGAVVKGHFQVG